MKPWLDTLKKLVNLLRLKAVLSLVTTAAWLMSLGGCATPAPAPAVCAQTPTPPQFLLIPPEHPPGYFQGSLRDFFLITPNAATKPTTTLGPPMSGPKD